MKDTPMTPGKMLPFAALILVASVFVSIANGQGKTANGQGKIANGQAKLDPQAAIEPRSGPGAGQKFLEQFVGDWDVVKTFYSRTGAPSRTTGTCRQRMIHDGRFLQSEFTFQQGDSKTTGSGLVGFEPGPGAFTSVWTDSRAARMSLRQSKNKFDGHEIELFSRSLGEGTDGRSSRTVTQLEAGSSKIVHRQYTLGDGGNERLMMELLMTRKENAAPRGRE